jgi:U2 small nuclear ribonucleoprotein A'
MFRWKLPANRETLFSLKQDQDAIDFTDNDISSLSNFPYSPRLRTLLLARNRVSHIQPSIAVSLPNVTTLILTANRVSELADLEPLKDLWRLTHLSLMENPVARKDVSELLFISFFFFLHGLSLL